jgi:hypothetical protein
MNKAFLLAIFFFILPGALFVQNLKKCSTTELMNAWFEANPEKKGEYEARRKQMLLLSQSPEWQNQQKTSATVYTIPVVFHVLHVGGSENISDAQIIDAVDILTRDFRKKNPDTVAIQTVFKNLAADVQIEFVLATKDPNGNCTNGIIRHFDPKTTAWNGDPNDYQYTWPSNKYMNIYVVKNITFNAAGYTFYPGTVGPAMDAIVVLSDYVGSIGTSSPFKSRVLTHEVGHWLDLEHVWGNNNNPGVSCGDDGISDTPITKGWNYCNLNSNDVCNPGIKENVENYMEYSYCDKMFTIGQANHMLSIINNNVGGRQNLVTPANLLQTGITNPSGLCAPSLMLIPAGNASVCAGGTIAVTGFTSSGAPSSYSWSCSSGGSVMANGNFSAAIFLPNQGTYTVTCTATNAAGAATSTTLVHAISFTTVINAGTMESFETNFPSYGWSLPNNTTPAQNWKQTSAAASDGFQSMYIQGEMMPIGKKAVLQTPGYDFKNNPGAGFSFRYAYARKTSTTTDRFRVFASKDCGANWKLIWSALAHQLSNGSGGIQNNIFIPNANQWKTYQLDLHPQFAEMLNEEKVIIRFEFQEDSIAGFQNRFYLDEINFTTPLGLKSNAVEHNISVYPNPAHSNLMVTIRDPLDEPMELKVIDLFGKTVKSMQAVPGGAVLAYDINIENLPAGVYFLVMEQENKKAVYRFIRE